MKLISKIAKTELRNLFYSPIAWFLTIAFMVQCAFNYTSSLNANAVTQEMGGMGLDYMTRLTARIFTGPSGLFNSVMQNLYLYIPLLTMGLISREINGGTISLLYSSPVKIRQIVFGKYLAMMLYSLILVLVVGIFMIAGCFHIKSADFGVLLSATLGFYLLLCAYSAIGLFMSSLTSYQVVAALSTFVMIGALSYIGKLWQGVDFVRDLTYFLSLAGRTQHMLTGLITSKDVIYFLAIVYIFLGLTIYKLQSGRETKPWYVSAGRYVAIVASALLVGYISSRPKLTGYWDTTANNDNTLTPNTQQIIRQLGDSPLDITVYSNFLDNYRYGQPENRNEYLSNWEIYLRFKPDIRSSFVNYYDTPLGLSYDMFSFYKGKTMKQIVEQNAKGAGIDLSMFQTPEQIHRTINLKPELNRFVMRLNYKGKSTYLRVFNDQMYWPGETEVSAAFKRLLQSRMPQVAFVTGDGERSTLKKGDREYKKLTSEKTFRYALINQGFDVDSLSLNKQDIPAHVSTLVLADPQTELSPAATQKILAYIAAGGNLLIAGEPGRQQILNPLLKVLGVQLIDGMLEQQSEDYAPTLVLPHLTKAGIDLSKKLSSPSVNTNPISMNGVAGLWYSQTNGFKTQPLLLMKEGDVQNTMARNPDLDMVSNQAAAGKGPAVGLINPRTTPESMNSRTKPVVTKAINAVPAATKSKADSGKSYALALALTRQVNGKEQRIIVSGDADFMSNTELGRYSPRISNFYFSTALFSWLDYGRFPIDASRPDAKDNRVTVSTGRVAFLKILYIWIFPGILLALGSILLIRRKRK